MERLNEEYKVRELINKNNIAIVYFSGSTCGACNLIKEKVEHILKKYPKIQSCEINGVEQTKLAAEYGVFSLPILILYIEQKESLRFGRNVDLIDFDNKLERYYKMLY